MCGIFGYIGHKHNAPEVILEGLSVLEYRGYDSWGIAIKDKDVLAVDKHVGKIGNAKTSLPAATIGIGHTRWATHGGVTCENAHPHLDCTKRIAVVHNGIVENYKSLKNILIESGHTFLSDTDSEVIAHLIEENLKKDELFEAVRSAFNACQGLSAIVVLDTKNDEIVAAKTGSPLIVGLGNQEFFIASDISALAPHIKEALYIKDHEMVVLSRNHVKLYSLLTGQEISAQVEAVDYVVGDDSMGSYSHFMMKEIVEQPEVLLRSVTDLPEIEKLASLIKSKQKTFFIAAGTAHHAALTGVQMLSQLASISVRTLVASEFAYIESEIDSHSLIVAFSQSGETIDVIEPLSRAHEKGAVIASIVNAPGSTIQRMSDVSILLHAGPEKSVASTKAYTAKLGVLLCLVYMLAQKKDAAELLTKIAQEENRILLPENTVKIQQLAHRLKNNDFMFAIGRGMSYPSALEAALKIKEVSYTHIEGLPGGELKHGSIALIEKGTPCIVFAPHDDTFASIISNAMEIKARGGMIVGISPKNSEVFDEYIEVADLGIGSILAQVLPVQLLAYYLALEKGVTDPDKPRNLAKSVTVK